MQILYQNNVTGAAFDITTLVTAASWNTKRVGSPAQLDVTIIRDPAVEIVEGGVISMFEGTGLFYGYVFKRSYSEKGLVQITAYDQMRYLKNKDSYVFSGQRADQIATQIAADFGIKLGVLANTGYVIPRLVGDNKTLIDILLQSLDLTLINTGKMFYLWDDFGALRISNVAESAVALMVGDHSLATGYTYTSDIDSDTANKIKLERNNKTTGKREIYIVHDSKTTALWGVLQHYDKVVEELNEAQIEVQADRLLEIKNRPKVSMELNALSDLGVRAGRAVKIELADVGVNGWYIIDEASHDLVKETMRLKAVIV